jgi:hypothetical protein
MTDVGFAAMERREFEPFGEALALHDAAARPNGASKWLLRASLVAFWSLAVAVVVARAAFFDPRVFSGFEHVAALARGVTGF